MNLHLGDEVLDGYLMGVLHVSNTLKSVFFVSSLVLVLRSLGLALLLLVSV